jgi:IclR family acetate operon transcriptional repressor
MRALDRRSAVLLHGFTILDDVQIVKVGASRVPTRIQSVTRATALLELVARDANGRTATEAARALGVSLATAYHLLNTLADSGFLCKTPERRYQLGPRIGLLAEAFLAQISAPSYLVEYVRQLAQHTGETAYLSAWRNDEALLVSVVEGHRAVRVADLHLGFSGAAHTRASGKMLLASGHPGTLERYLAVHVIESRTGDGPHGADALCAELELARAQGYAVDEEEFSEGVACIAAPVADGSLALGISTPIERYRSHREELVASVLRLAAEARALRRETAREAS